MNKFRTLLLAACLVCLLCACGNSPQPITTTQPAPIDTASPILASPVPSDTSTPTTLPTPADTPTPLPNDRQTPMTLMLSRPTASFDSVAFLKDFISLIEKENLQVVTYRMLSEDPDLSATQQGKLLVITFDNIYLRYPINDGVLEMIDLLKEAGYPAVVGVITEDDYIYADTANTLTSLSDAGWEIASNTDTYRNLLEVQGISPKAIAPEINTSLDKLENTIGIRPITLLLPYGQMTNGDEQIKRTGVQWVVGIGGGTVYDISAAYYFVGREGAAGTAQETYDRMLQRFSYPGKDN